MVENIGYLWIATFVIFRKNQEGPWNQLESNGRIFGLHIFVCHIYQSIWPHFFLGITCDLKAVYLGRIVPSSSSHPSSEPQQLEAPGWTVDSKAWQTWPKNHWKDLGKGRCMSSFHMKVRKCFLILRLQYCSTEVVSLRVKGISLHRQFRKWRRSSPDS